MAYKLFYMKGNLIDGFTFSVCKYKLAKISEFINAIAVSAVSQSYGLYCPIWSSLSMLQVVLRPTVWF